MLALPMEIIPLLMPFAPLFSEPVFQRAVVLIVGAILAPGKRTVTAALRAVGLASDPHFQRYHRVLSRSSWYPREAARILLCLLVRTFAPTGPLLFGIDEHLERRRGPKIAARAIHHDAARSSKSFFVKASGLRWVAMMFLAPIPWAKRVWALPFLTVLAPSERYDEEHKRPHKTVTDWARQMILQVARWLPKRTLVFVADQSYAALDLLGQCTKFAKNVTIITRLRLDAALYEPAPPREPGKKGRPAVKGKRLPTLEKLLDDKRTKWQRITVGDWYNRGPREIEVATDTAVWYHSGKPPVPIRWVLIRDPQGHFKSQALLCTDLNLDAEQIVSYFVHRWQLEVTFEESRAHLGIETQRQWTDKAIARTTPALFGLFSLVTLMAHQILQSEPCLVRQAAWYAKDHATFSDAIALVRRKLWPCAVFSTSSAEPDSEKLMAALLERMTETLCYAA